MARVIWSEPAADNLTAITDYLLARDARAAARISGQLYLLAESLQEFPNRGRPVANGERELPGVPPYVIRYRVDDDVVFILRIRHGRRRSLA